MKQLEAKNLRIGNLVYDAAHHAKNRKQTLLSKKYRGMKQLF